MDLHVFMELTVSSDVASAGSDAWIVLGRFAGLAILSVDVASSLYVAQWLMWHAQLR